MMVQVYCVSMYGSECGDKLPVYNYCASAGGAGGAGGVDEGSIL